MVRGAFDWSRFHRVPIVGILRGMPPEWMRDIGRVCVQAGMANLEVTLNSPRAHASIEILRDSFGGDLNIGAGTVNTPADVAMAVAAGAQFIVTPTTIPAVIETAGKLGVPIFPGAQSPTEILLAWQTGASAVKIFPAGQVGSGYVRAVKEAMPEIALLPTGGIGAENLKEYFDVGAIGCGVGSPLFVPGLLKKQDWPALQDHIRHFVSCCPQSKVNE